MKLFLATTLGLTLSAQLVAQSSSEREQAFLGTARGVVTDSSVVPGTEGALEGAQRFPDLLPENPADYVELPQGPRLRRPHSGAERMVRFNPATSVETTLDSVAAQPNFSQWLAGQPLVDEVGELLPESFGALNAVSVTQFPWSASCRIFFNRAGGSYVCSGSLIDAKHVITAGHCLHEGGTGGVWSTNVVVAPSWDGDANAYGTANGIELTAFSSWTASGSYSGDMGFIHLDRPVGFLTGWFGAGYSSNTSWWMGSQFHMAGYPGGCMPGAPNQRYYTYGTWDSLSSTVAFANISVPCWIGGMSGSGVYFRDGQTGQRYIYGDLSHGWGAPTQTTRFGVCRMTQTKFDNMYAEFISNYPTTNLDLVPLVVRSSSTSVARGAALANLTYKVFNSAHFNPAAKTVTVDVYLSSNSNISTADTRIQTHTFNWDFGILTGVSMGAQGPVIPAATAPGTYYVGVIIRDADAASSNNDTDGFDAHRITVL